MGIDLSKLFNTDQLEVLKIVLSTHYHFTPSDIDTFVDRIIEVEQTLNLPDKQTELIIDLDLTDIELIINELVTYGLPLDGLQTLRLLLENLKLKDIEEFIKVKNCFRTATSVKQFVQEYDTYNTIMGRYFNQTTSNGSRGGMGRGEVMVLMCVQGTKSGGSSKKDIITDTGIYEVKELNIGHEFDAGFIGKVGGKRFTDRISLFLNIIKRLWGSDKELENMGYDDIVVVLNEVFYPRFTKLLDMNEINATELEIVYNGFKRISKLLIDRIILSETNSTLTTDGKKGKKSFTVNDQDAEKIKPNTDVSIAVGKEIDNLELRLTLKTLQNHEYVNTPILFATDLYEVVDIYFQQVDGMVIFHHGNKKPAIYIDKDNYKEYLYIKRITQTAFKFSLITKLKRSYEIDQLGR